MEFLFISNIKFLLPNFDLRKREICSLNVIIKYKLFINYLYMERSFLFKGRSIIVREICFDIKERNNGT